MFFLLQSLSDQALTAQSLGKSLVILLLVGFVLCSEGSISTTFAENGETLKNQLGKGIVDGLDVEQVEIQAIHQPSPSHSFVVRIKTNVFQNPSPENFLDLYFDENRSFIRGEVSGTLENIRRILSAEPETVLLMDAHCDERGSKAFSLIVGDRWAHHVQTYFNHLGLPVDRISRVTYGGEKVWCRGKSASCWEGNLLTKQVFGLMAPIDPQNGCLVRLSLSRSSPGSYMATPIPRSPTLQRLHLAQSP